MLVQKHYDDAILVQDACNITGVAHSFVTVLGLCENELAQRSDATVLELNRHPLAVMYASKVLSLIRGDLRPMHDLRQRPGWHLSIYVGCLSQCFTKMRELEKKTPGYQLVVDSAFLNGQELTCYLAVRIAELTHCENMDVFGQAYDACKRVARMTEDEAAQAIKDELGLHCVMVPDLS